MKKIIFLLLLINSTFLFSQEDKSIGKSVEGVIPIKRTEFSNNSEVLNKNNNHTTTPSPSTPTGNSNEVGMTEGNLSVSLTGGANYNISIMVPPGIKGIEPQISLNYNSQKGNGIAGYGWDISGVSMITKIPATKFHDNTIDCVDMDNNDRYALDGQRLIVKNGTNGVYGADGTEYETENFSNIKITSYGVYPGGAIYGPAYFIVEYPDGSLAHYGNSPTNDPSRTILEWGISFWENPQGIRLNYFYYTNNINSLTIKKIEYGSVINNPQINTIEFVYKDRQRKEESQLNLDVYFQIKRIDKILDKIIVKGNNLPIRNYYLNYNQTSLRYERLISITEKNGDNSKNYNPTVFDYGNDTPENISYNSQSINISLTDVNYNNSKTISGDFDGDGDMDIILYPTNLMDKYWLFNGLQNNNTNIGYQHNIGYFREVFSTSWLNASNNLEQKQGWCVIKHNVTNNTTFFHNYSVGSINPLSGSVNSINLEYTKNYQFPKFTHGYWQYPCWGPMQEEKINLSTDKLIPDPNSEPVWVTMTQEIPKVYLNGDFNGDGLSDVIIIEKSLIYTQTSNCQTTTFTYPGGKYYFLDLDRRISSNYVNVGFSIQTTANSNFYVDDFNGDGKTDILVVDNGILRVYMLNDNNQLVLSGTTNNSNITLNNPILLGDYNGDGKTDFITSLGYGYQFAKFTSTGSNTQPFSIQTYNMPFNYSPNTGSSCPWVYYLIPSDINKDGKTDIILASNQHCYGNNQGFVSVRFFRNDGGGVFTSDLYRTTTFQTGIGAFALPVFLNSNKKDYRSGIDFITNNKIIRFNSDKDFSKEHLLKSVTLGNGVKDIITYHPLVKDIDDVYFTPASLSEVYPKLELKNGSNLQVVSRLEKVSYNSYKKQDYKYYNAVINVEGLGFQGFKGTYKTNWYDDQNTPISTVTKYDTSKRGAKSESYSVLGQISGNFYDNVPSSFITKTVLNNVVEILPNKVFKIQNHVSTAYNGIENTSVQTYTGYDQYNNPNGSATLYNSGSTNQKTVSTTIEYENLPTSTPYIIGRLSKKNVETVYEGDTMTSEEIYTYNSSNLLSRIKSKGHLTNYITEDYEYDIYGNKTKTIISAQGLQPRFTEYEYDSSSPNLGRFLTKSIDLEALETAYTYDSSTGALLTETLPSNQGSPLITTYEYDSWGIIKKSTDYLGKSLNYSYTWLSPGVHGAYATGVLGDDDSTISSIYDDLGRKLAEGVRTINNNSTSTPNTSWISYEYDIYGRINKVYEPTLSFLPLSTGLYSSTNYDSYGRLIQTVEYTGKTTNISYSGLTTVVNDGINTSTTIKNSVGQLKSKTDSGGTILYNYFANGNLKQSVFNGIETDIQQNGWGRKTKLIDPSAGPYTYKYNELGETTMEQTPNGTTEYELDNIGKLLSKTIKTTNGNSGNSISTYKYDPSSKLLNHENFYDVDENSEIDYYFKFDNYKRLNRTEETRNDNIFNFTTEIEYDSFGRIYKEHKKTVAYGQSTENLIKNTYKNGFHWQILDDSTNQVLWQNTGVNARGQLTVANYCNNISVTNTYDQYGYATEFKHDKVTNVTTNVMKLNTAFTAIRGNLNYRTNSMFDYREDFTYDNLDRLKTWKETGDLLWNCTFNSSVQGFQSVNGASVTVSNNKLAVSGTVGSTGKGTHKLVISNADVGKVINIKGNIQINTANAGTTIHISFYSKNPTTGATQGFATLGMPINNGNFSFGTTIGTQNLQDLYVMFLMRNPSNPNAYMAVSLDDIKITLEKNEEQLYDNLGRIEENNIGNYNYTNSSKVFQNTSVELKPKANTYYQQRSDLKVTYNVFKGPVDIIEENFERYSFTYNAANSRSTMYYGGLDEEKAYRPLRKHYSTDGSVEVKYDISTDKIEFVTYIGGDAYSAPIVLKDNGSEKEYLYLHRDYLSSIVAITNQNGDVIEKRLFDAWGNILKVQDGAGNDLDGLTVLDRGYTGHEHLQVINLIHMNGRLYDPIVHRFLQPDNNLQDPLNTQNYNRYGYVLNNPLRYVDFSGETGTGCDGCPNGNSPGDSYELSGYQQSGFGSALQTIGLNWDEWRIKDWSNKNLNFNSWGDGIKSAGNWAGRNLESIGGWFNRNIESIFGGASDPVYLDATPSFSGHQLSSGWQNEGFQYKMNNELPSMLNNFDSGSNQKIFINAYNFNQNYLRPNYLPSKYDYDGMYITLLSSSMGMAESKIYNKVDGKWFSLKKLKTYNIKNYNGNYYTGWKGDALKISKRLKWGGRGIGVYNFNNINDQYINNKINTFQLITEQLSNTYSTFGGIQGAAWGLGWELGRWLTNREFYQNWKEETFLPWRYKYFNY